jgi:hypothetical protein
MLLMTVTNAWLIYKRRHPPVTRKQYLEALIYELGKSIRKKRTTNVSKTLITAQTKEQLLHLPEHAEKKSKCRNCTKASAHSYCPACNAYFHNSSKKGKDSCFTAYHKALWRK